MCWKTATVAVLSLWWGDSVHAFLFWYVEHDRFQFDKPEFWILEKHQKDIKIPFCDISEFQHGEIT